MDAGAKIRAARKEAGLSQVDLGTAMGVPQSVVSDWENGKLQSWRDVADKLTAKLGKPKGYLTAEESSSNLRPTKGIEVVGTVQGGAFQLAIEWPEEDRFEIPVPSLPGYERITLRALQVRGPSVNLLYPDGSFVIVADAADVDVRPGDKVVVYASQGLLREATIKVVEQLEDGRIVLWPRSTHPDFQQPIYINPDDPEDQDRPVIAYVVVGSFAQEVRPPPPIQIGRRKR